jgi:phosphodiesterase/alkaline phosphatase D-like protein
VSDILKFLVKLAVVGAGWVAVGGGPQVDNPRWFWSGGLTSTSIQIKARLEPNQPVTLSVSGGTDRRPLVSRTDELGSATFVVDELTPGLRYSYAVSTTGLSGDGTFRTPALGPDSYTVAFASCASTGSTSDVFAAIRAQDPLLFLHMGDLHYQNIRKNDITRFRHAYDQVMTSAAQVALYRTTPIQYVWDDHDFGPNDSNRDSPSRSAALAAYRRFAPHHPLQTSDSGINQAFTLGRVRFIVLDTRSHRAPRETPAAERTMLGREQLEWLEQELVAAVAAPLVVLVNTVPWITKIDEATPEGWAPYAAERTRIADVIVRLNLTSRLIMLSGDAHQAALDDGTNSQYSVLPEAPTRGFVVAHAAPLDRWTSAKGGPYSHGAQRKRGQFGLLKIADDGRQIQATVEVRHQRQAIPGMALTLTCVNGSGCSY